MAPLGSFLLWLACCLANDGSAMDNSRNPDRWVMLDLSETGTQSVGADQDVLSAKNPDHRSARVLDVTSTLNLLVPLSDRWTITAQGSVDLNQTVQTAGDQHPAQVLENTNDNSNVGYGAGFRYYFLDHYLTAAVRPKERDPEPKNPDQWPSVSFAAGGSNSVNYQAGSSSGDILKGKSSSSLTLTSDARLPLLDRLTVVITASGNITKNVTPEFANTHGQDSVSDVVSLGAELRYFFLGKNLIEGDLRKNPDQWTMAFVRVAGAKSVLAHNTSTFQGAQNTFDIPSYTASLQTGLRVPVTNHLSLRAELGGLYVHSYSPEVPLQTGLDTRTPSIRFLAGLRYFFF